MRFLLTALILLAGFYHAAPVYAQALPVNLVMNRNVAGSIVQVLTRRGFAQNDRVYGATLSQVSTTLTRSNVVSTTGVGAVASPSWMNIVYNIGTLNRVLSVSNTTTLSLATDSNGNQYLSLQKTPTPLSSVGSTLQGNANIDMFAQWSYNLYRSPQCGTTQLCYQLPSLPADPPVKMSMNYSDTGPFTLTFNSIEELGTRWTPIHQPPNASKAGDPTKRRISWIEPPHFTYSDAGTPSLVGKYRLVSDRVMSTYTNTQTGEVVEYEQYPARDQVFTWAADTSISWSGAYVKLNNFDQLATHLANDTTPVGDVALAEVANEAWRRAALDPAYDGAPYSPVTPDDSAAARRKLGEDPLFRDFMRKADVTSETSATSFVPVAETAALPQPAPNPDPGTNPTPTPGSIYNVNVVNKVAVDLGPDPGIGLPNLEPTPTAKSILDPILNMLPSFKDFQLPAHQSVCPTPSFTVFGMVTTVDSHCILIEQNRNTIHLAMMLVFAIASVTIVLKA